MSQVRITTAAAPFKLDQRPQRIRTANLPARRAAAMAADMPAELGPQARRLASFPHSRRGQLGRFADHLAAAELARATAANRPAAAAPNMPAWVRIECGRRGIAAELARDAFDHLAEQNHAIDRRRELRRAAWIAHNANRPKTWPQWRDGFAKRWQKRVDAHDYTAIAGYDVLHSQFQHDYPELADEYRFFAELLGPLPRPISSRQLWLDALELAADHLAAADSSASSAADPSDLF